MVGMSERTTAQGTEILARNWFERSGGAVTRVIAVELPKVRAFMSAVQAKFWASPAPLCIPRRA